jgi:hypothetical protein
VPLADELLHEGHVAIHARHPPPNLTIFEDE